MDGVPNRFWGKLDWPEDAPVPLAWHPLQDHCADVAACCEALLALPLLRGRIASLAGLEDLDPVSQQRLCVIAGLHDVGKFNHGFQNKCELRRSPRAGHVGQTLAALFMPSEVKRALFIALDLQQLEPWFENPDMVSSMIIAGICHHGRPVTLDCESPDPALWRANTDRDPIAEAARLASNLRRWFPAAFATDAPRLNATPQLQHAFNGLLMLADWLGSDQRFFPFSASPEGDRMPIARAAARQALRETGLDPAAPRLALDTGLPPFSVACRHQPRPAQRLALPPSV
jgi:CRISPR-associated endonuclease/helicase Cas3